ncbi:MAG: restriction endonuclease subunit S [Fibrobacter sp.]|nr:restriction endonuclease subunit S [Fibrobacter sp.]
MNNGWKEYCLEDLLSYEQPTPYIVESTEYSDAFETPVLTAGASFILGYTDEAEGIYDQIPVIIFDDFTTASKYVNFPFKVKSSAMKILTANKELVLPKFIYYRMQTIKFEHSTHKRYWIQQYSKIKVAVPSLSEQKRIVDKIEELFSELDSAVEILKKTKEQLAVYRQSVLESAFEGKYTIDWRKQNKYSVSEFKKELHKKRCDAGNTSEYQLMEEITLPLIPKGWDWVFVGDIVTSPEYGTSKKSLKNGKVPVLRMGNMKNGSIDWGDLVYSNDKEDNKKYCLHDQDVLFNRTNSPEHVGKTSIFKGEQEAIFAGYIIRINQLPEINAQYLTYYMNSHTAKKYSNKVKTDGVNQSNINGKKLLSYPFPLCTREEQDKIVDEIEIRLSKCDSIEKTVNEALIQADAMRQSVLKKAFEGGL